MNKPNFDRQMQDIVATFGGSRKRLLLHACCAPCSSACLEKLKDYFDITVFFYNPNIEDVEYFKRKAELARFIAETGWANMVDCDHDTSAYYSAVKGLEDCPEGGKRCAECFRLRLERTAREAKKGNYDYFTTTLTISPLKNAQLINAIGQEVAAAEGATWLPSDFKKREGYLRSCTLSKEHNLYRQNYCGCIFSLRDAQKNRDMT